MGGHERVALVGAGAVGTMLGALVASRGHEVVVCGRRPVSELTLIVDDSEMRYPVRWVDHPTDVGPADWVVLATKVHHTADAREWLSDIPVSDGQDGRILVAQNGVDHVERLRQLTTREIVPALVFSNAERAGLGKVRMRQTGKGLVVPRGLAGEAAAALFRGTVLDVEQADDFVTAAWDKLLMNVAANPLTALTLRRLEVMHDPALEGVVRDLLAETVAVAQAEGAHLTERNVTDMTGWLRQLPAGAPTSMLQDRLAGAPMEHHGILGPVVRLGQRHGIQTPVAATILAVLDAAQRANSEHPHGVNTTA